MVGQRVRQYVRERMAARGIESISALADQADVGRDTLQAWFRGRGITPIAGTKVALELGVTYEDLLTARDGRPARPTDELEAMIERAAAKAVRLLMDELRREGRDG